jgi:ubiquinone/menaquinone biosynthesis C-methylase UbiE
MDDYIKPGLKIIDIGAGTGRYAFYLAQQNCSVTALDIVPKFVTLMQAKAKEQSVPMAISRGNAIDLSQFEDAQFDMVLCMGPLYHLKTVKQRKTALGECLRILNPGGIIAVAYTNRYASHLIEIFKNDKPLDTEFLKKIIDKGIQPGGKSDSFYFSYPAEIEQMMSGFGVVKEKNVGTDGVTYLLGKRDKKLSKNEFNYWLDYHLQTCENPSLLGYSLHGLYLGQKPK